MMIWLKESDVILTINISHYTAGKDLYLVAQDLANALRKSLDTQQILSPLRGES
ncbi:hypothetical protein [Legionella sp. 16cNR16C]|uniref:hypothetical protein n=1 Tax=Legionella sp. 16cNR16C TaxID=2905656 RepID=UPI001E595BD6|nr:hypothetical protein [Legionella sp. 16cNR16C]MCE3046243.1 hypothetical protein [Legionella sp. 16cNR16C]